MAFATFSTFLIISSLSIAGVYYDPLQAESGGEAVQLHNNGLMPVPLDSISLTTKQTSYPLPAATLLPGEGYIIADTDWSTLRDNLSWPTADLEVPLSLANTEGFVQIVKDDTIIDELYWNGSFKAREGYMMTADGEQPPFFWNSSSAVTDLHAQVVVLDGAPVISNVSITDDAPDEGIQLLSYNRSIAVTATIIDANNESVSAFIEFLGNEYELLGNNTNYSARIPFSGVEPGVYTLRIRALRGALSTESLHDITVLSSVSIRLSGELIFTGAPGEIANSSITIHNEGNIPKTVALQHSIPGVQCTSESLHVLPGQSESLHCNATIPIAAAGTYEHNVRLIAS